MLIQFSVRNYKTFKERATFSLLASNYDKDTRAEENIIDFEQFNLRLLKSAVMYGANASGKSKFVDAFQFMRTFVRLSSREGQKGDTIEVEPFVLNDTSKSEGTEFEIIFLYNKAIYRYGFEADSDKIIAEWFYRRPKTKEVELFYRNFQDIKYHARSFAKGGILIKQKLIRDNALFLSVAAQFNELFAADALGWFNQLRTLSGLSEYGYRGYTVHRMQQPEHKVRILELLQAADFGIQDIKFDRVDPDNLPEDVPQDVREAILNNERELKGNHILGDVKTLHSVYDARHKRVGMVEFSLYGNESSGTQKFFALTGPILDSLDNGYTLVVDELDSRLHPNLVCELIALFNSKAHNPHNAQLVFNTHNTNLLSHDLFRRDQVWFVEKDRYGAAKIYSLADFKSTDVRKGEPFEENYIRGKYGATPYLGEFQDIVDRKPKNDGGKKRQAARK